MTTVKLNRKTMSDGERVEPGEDGYSGRLSLERFVKIKMDYENTLTKLELLLSGKERVSFSGVDYTLFEIENLKKDLDWYEEFMEKNRNEIRSLLPPRRTRPYFAKSIEDRDTLPAKKMSAQNAQKETETAAAENTANSSVRVLPVKHVF